MNLEIRELNCGDEQCVMAFKDGFTHYAFIQDILPRPVQVLYGQHLLNQKLGNGYKAARICAGITPGYFCSESSLLEGLKIKEILIENIASGDLVSIPDHAFVFLDHDISISMNERGTSLMIQRTSSVLKKFGLPKNVLKEDSEENKKWRKQITVQRKDESWRYLETMMPALMRLYTLSNHSTSCMIRSDRNYGEVESLMAELHSIVCKEVADPNLDWKIKQTWKNVYRAISFSFSCTLAEKYSFKKLEIGLSI